MIYINKDLIRFSTHSPFRGAGVPVTENTPPDPCHKQWLDRFRFLNGRPVGRVWQWVCSTVKWWLILKPSTMATKQWQIQMIALIKIIGRQARGGWMALLRKCDHWAGGKSGDIAKSNPDILFFQQIWTSICVYNSFLVGAGALSLSWLEDRSSRRVDWGEDSSSKSGPLGGWEV